MSAFRPKLETVIFVAFVVAIAGTVAGGILWWLGQHRSSLRAPGLIEEGPVVPEFAFTERSGQVFHSSGLKGRVWISAFVFTNCQGPCPVVSSEMRRLQQDLPEDVHLVTFTVDPERDTPAVLQSYAQRFGAGERWSFLTGERAELYRVIIEGFKLPVEYKSLNQIIHAQVVALVDHLGQIRGYYDTFDRDRMLRLREDAAKLAAHVRPPIPVAQLPPLNAALNASSALLLIAGFLFIKRRIVVAHKTCMMLALACSLLFLVSYLTYHYYVGSKPFPGQGWVRPVYFSILISHSILAALIVPLALITVFQAWRGNFVRHKAIARWTLPIWLYVSVTGVLVYLMLYTWF